MEERIKKTEEKEKCGLEAGDGRRLQSGTWRAIFCENGKTRRSGYATGDSGKSRSNDTRAPDRLAFAELHKHFFPVERMGKAVLLFP